MVSFASNVHTLGKLEPIEADSAALALVSSDNSDNGVGSIGIGKHDGSSSIGVLLNAERS